MPKSPVPRTPAEAYALNLVPTEALTRKFVQVLEVLKRYSQEPLGDYVEFGVYNGTSMSCMYDALSRLRLSYIRLIGFDSFEGLPPDVAQDDDGVWTPAQFACPKQIAIQNLQRKGIPDDRVKLIDGWYRDTLTGESQDIAPKSVSIVMIDCDAYSSASLALHFVSPLLRDLSVILFDDWRLNDLDLKEMGEFRAFHEFLAEHVEYSSRRLGRYNRKSQIFLLQRMR